MAERGHPRCISMVWESLPDAPAGIKSGSSTVIGDKAYFTLPMIHEFNSSTNQWVSLPDHPLVHFTVVSVDSILTTVGGEPEVHYWRNGIAPSNKLYSYINGEWVEHFPPMPTKRLTPAAVYTDNTLVVAGGTKDDDSFFFTTVEILNTQNKQWSSVSSLPFPINQPPTTICGDHIYLHASVGSPKQDDYSVLKCSLKALVQSKPSSAVWERIAELPYCRSSLATICGQVLAVCGMDDKGKHSNLVHQYDPTTNSWRIISEMSVARLYCLTASLPGDKLIVVGGYDKSTERSVEIATVNYV